MTRVLILATLAVALISCGQRVVPAGPEYQVQDTKSF
jgi:hypothetical protein|tara:strand:+ start:36 stop:146 length:111 start_codon:yes stop_codon:yes gene_type:complete